MNHYLRIYPPSHPLGHPRLWLWQVCSMGDVEISGTSDDKQDCVDMATSALDGVMQQEEDEAEPEEPYEDDRKNGAPESQFMYRRP